MKKFFSGLALLAAVILLASCQDDLFDWGHKLKLSENEIAFRVGKTNTTATRADVQRTVVAPTNVYDLPVTDDGQQFCLMETVTSLDDEVFNTFDGAVTRGTPIYTENFAQVPGYNGFAGTAYGGFADVAEDDEFVENPFDGTYLWGGQSKYRAAFTPTGDSLVYSHNYDGPDYNLAWPDDGKLLFFLEAPAPAAGSENTGVSNMQFWPAWSTTEPNGSIEFDYVSPTDPLQQKDLLFTSKWISKDTKDTDNKILFYHALTGIRFKVGKPSTHDIHVNINKVTLKQHMGAGHCEIIPVYEADVNTSAGNPSNANTSPSDATKSAQCVTWTSLGTPTDFTIDFDSFIEEDEEGKQILQDADSAAYTFPASFNAVGKGDKNSYYNTVGTGDQNFNNAKYEYTMFLIPQPLADHGVSMEIEYTYVFGDDKYIPEEVHTNTAHVVISDPNAAWKAGELHTYYLTSEGVYIKVEDTVEGNVKKSLEIANVGTFGQYQRALMYGNWVYTDSTVTPHNHLIVASADLTQHGDFADYIGQNWALGSDGFYYYKYPINVGNKPNYPLFDTYTGPTTTPFPGTHLEFDISAQAVRYSSQTDDGALYTADYNKDFVNAEWNLENVTIVQLGTNTAGTVGQTVLSWLETSYEVYNGDN
ncbi:MAG: hypothetical protein J6Y84_01620 [Bacteroidaceae bacterium]|nr:hypothetical protein [Bacteroidaceae bacterium]